MFMANVLNAQSGALVIGRHQQYREVADGLVRMRDLSRSLTGNFVRIQGGTFQMGSPPGAWASTDDERPVRNVTVSGFYMSRFPVTQGEWREIMGTTVRQQRDIAYRDQGWDPGISGEGDDHPMHNVSWFEAVEFANRLSLRAGLTPAYTISWTWDGGSHVQTVSWNRNANGYRLPTEAEWEFAARGGMACRGNFTFSGSNAVGEVAWYSGNSGGRTHEVGTRRPNALGLYDMSGNVSEWVYDRSGAYPNTAQTNPAGPAAGDFRMTRGGCWSNAPGRARSATRGAGAPGNRYENLGFRVVRL